VGISFEVVERVFSGSLRRLAASEIVFDALPEGIEDYLLLAGSRTVREELSFAIVRDKDGPGNGRGHVALEEDA
jgi:hypothetical protein